MTTLALRALGAAFDEAATTCLTKDLAARRIEQRLRAAGYCITPLILPVPIITVGRAAVNDRDWHLLLFEIELQAERTEGRPTSTKNQRF